MKKIQIKNVSRRNFIKTTGLAVGGLVLHGCFPSSEKKGTAKIVPLNAFIRITEDNIVTLISHQAEMGQGIQTTLPAILADELGANWSSVKIENGLTDPAFQNPKFKFQFTGNAESIRAFHDPLRKMAATAREMLKQAASNRWQVNIETIDTENSHVIHKESNKKVPFGDLVMDASALTPPKNPKIKAPSEWKLVGGKSLPRVDILEKVNGKAIYGIDVVRPGMVHAAIEICPYFGGSIKSINDNGILNLPGVIDIVRIPIANPVMAYRPGFPKKEAVAVVADKYWQAKTALEKMEIVYDKGPNEKLDSEKLYQIYEDKLKGNEWHESVNEGDTKRILKRSNKKHKAKYFSAWQSHATMEPMNATADVSGDKVEIWAPTQGQEMAELLIEGVLGIPKENITVNRTYLGGGFGRRLLADYIVQAVVISKKIQRPVKLIWSREDDMQHDFYRPGALQELTAVLNDDGLPEAINFKLVSPSILQAVVNANFVFEGEGPSMVEGAKETPYSFKNYSMHTHLLRVPPPSSVWRSTGFGPNVFALESFMDELALKNTIDPITFRKKLVADERAAGVLDAVAKASQWYENRKPGHYMGVSLTHSFESFAAQVIEISINTYGILDIHKITTAVDVGIALDPALCRASIESGITWGLNQALTSEINFKNGRTVESNFHDYKIIAPAEFSMELETVFVNSGAKLGGIAESGPILVAPALCNAIFQATGERFRTLPLKKHGIYTRYAADYLPYNQKLKKKFKQV